MQVVYKYPLRISPTTAEILRKWSCTCRYIYNRQLRLSSYLYKRYGITMGMYGVKGTHKRLTTLRQRYDWIGDAPCCTEQKTLASLDKAFKNFFRRVKQGQTPGYPRFKRRGDDPGLYFTKELFSIRVDDQGRHYIKIPKAREIRIDIHRPYLTHPDDTVSSVTLTFDRMWYICILVTTADPIPVKRHLPSVGIDVGVAKTITRSDGVIHQIDTVRIKCLEDRVSHLQKKLSKKVGSKKGEKKSGHWIAQRKRIGRLQSKVADIRRTFNDRASRVIVNSFDKIVIEDLNIRGMSASAAGTIEEPGSKVAQKSGLNRAILRNGFFQLRTMLEYKAAKVGAQVIAVQPHYTSQMCSECGHTESGNRLTQSEFVCKKCGFSLNADLNAAKNILKKV